MTPPAAAEPKPRNANITAALITVGVGLVLTVCLPAYLVTQPAWHPWPWLGLPPLDFTQTGQIGDTIGGVAGPILNFVGLMVVYFSLREQTRASSQQFAQSQREVTLDLVFKLVDYLEQQVKKNAATLDVLHTQLNVLELSYTDQRLHPDSPREAEPGRLEYPPVSHALHELAKIRQPLQLLFGLFQTTYATLQQSELDASSLMAMYRLLASVYAPVTAAIENRPTVAEINNDAKTIRQQADSLFILTE